MLVADLPEARKIRVVRHPFEDQRRRAVGQWAVDDIAMTGDPAHVRRTPVDVAVVIVENVLMRYGRVNHIAAGSVQYTFGRAGRTRRVEDEQRIFGAHFLRRAVGRGSRHGVMVPDVAPVFPADIVTRAFDDDAFFDRRTLFQRFIDIAF